MVFFIFLYNVFIRLFVIGAKVLAIFQPKVQLLVEGRKNLLAKIKSDLTNERRRVIWFHCASLGEFEQGRPLIEELKSKHIDICIVLTFFSPSGYEVRKKYKTADFVYYLPFDTKKNAETFIHLLQPTLCVFVKYELWYHYLKTLHQQKIQTILISAIFQERHAFFKWYGVLQRQMLQYFSHIFVQNESSQKLLQTINIQNATIAGDTRIDRAIAIAHTNKNIANIALFKGSQTLLIAGSTWKADEELIKEAFSSFSNIKLLIAPHEIHTQHIEDILQLFGKESCLLEETDKLAKSKVCILNSMGQLAYSYRYADYVWIGGGFNKTGIHNSIEAAVYGKPLFWGPHYQRYQEAIDLIALKAAKSVDNASQFSEALNVLKNNKKMHQSAAQAALSYTSQQRGATSKIMKYIIENVF